MASVMGHGQTIPADARSRHWELLFCINLSTRLRLAVRFTLIKKNDGYITLRAVNLCSFHVPPPWQMKEKYAVVNSGMTDSASSK